MAKTPERYAPNEPFPNGPFYHGTKKNRATHKEMHGFDHDQEHEAPRNVA